MSDPNFFDFYGYDIEVNIGTLTITTALKKGEFGLSDKLTVIASENTSRTAMFTFIPPEELIDLNALQGEEVDIFVRDKNGWTQIFSGFVDVPLFDFINRKITLKCNDERANKIIELPYSYISSIGLYNTTIFGKTIDQSDELDKRLQTVTASFDFDNFGNPQLTSWTPKGIYDFIFINSDVRQNSNPNVVYTSRIKTMNTVNLTLNYSYQRLHQQSASFVWPGYSDFINDWFNQGKPSFPTRAIINSAATGGNWHVVNPNGNANFTPLWPAGGYSGIVWQPNQVTNNYIGETKLSGYEKDSLGNFVTINGNKVPKYAPILDANGKQIMDLVGQTIIDTSSQLCRGAQFIACCRFAQNITETYTVEIYAPQSVAKFGAVNQYSTLSLTDPYDVTVWEQAKAVTNTINNFYLDQDTNRSNFINAVSTAYAKAKHDILQAHRDITVNFQTKLIQPRVDLIHTIQFSMDDPRGTTYIHAIGKVSTVTHSFDFKKEVAYTDITLAISKTDIGSVSEDTPAVNVPIQDPSYIGTPPNISLGTHLGLNPNPAVTPGADKWNGWIGNKNNSATATQGIQRTTFPESFIVDFPAIPDSIRGQLTYSSDTSLVINIPNDFLETST